MAIVKRANNTGRVWRITICPVPVLPLPTCFSHRTHEVCHDHRSNWWDHDKNNKNKDNYNHRMRLISAFFQVSLNIFPLCLRCLHCSVRNAAWYAVSADISLQPQVLQQWHWQLWWSFTQTIRHAGKRYNLYGVSQK